MGALHPRPPHPAEANVDVKLTKQQNIIGSYIGVGAVFSREIMYQTTVLGYVFKRRGLKGGMVLPPCGKYFSFDHNESNLKQHFV